MKYVTSIVGGVLLAVASSFIAAVPSAQEVSASLDQPTRRAVVEAAAKMLRERYVFPDVGDQAARAIESALRGGAYDRIDQPAAFAERLTADLRAVARDKHLRVNLESWAAFLQPSAQARSTKYVAPG